MLIYLPKSHATVCLKPGETLTPEEADELDEYILAVAQAREEGQQ